MKPVIVFAYAVPIVLFLVKKFVSVFITIPCLVVGCLVTYYFYNKSKDENLYKVLAFYGFDFFFIFIGVLFNYIYL